jgi:uncharacterized membrane protein YcgQ (UPF0703/DUF1980 family)
MRKFLLIVFSFLSIYAISQGDRKPQDTLPSSPVYNDSVIRSLENRNDSLARVRDAEITNEQFLRNTQALIRIQNEHTARQKKGAIVRIAIGVGLLIVLVIGLMRKRKKEGPK